MNYDVILKRSTPDGVIQILRRLILGTAAPMPTGLPPHPLFDDNEWQTVLGHARGWLRKDADERWHFRVEYDPLLTPRIDDLKDFLEREVEMEVADEQGELIFNLNYI